MPTRCDEPTCKFHNKPLEWNGKPLPLILDHKNGVNSDNRPQNLRLLCPNCDAQLETRAGGNKGRVKKSSGGFGLVRGVAGKKNYVLPTEPGHFALTGGQAKMTIHSPKRKS
ncbi:HNH endonuclease [Bradyrhizobium sp. 1(2017)]|uniref:HNH endonuclease n=1 Tax=Bradyrhizobium sp. 1(2017) TaxID=1404888 RepID=UPI0039C8A87A